MPMNKVVHAAQRAAFSAAIDVTINAVRGKGTEKLSENAVKLVNLAEPLLKTVTRLPPLMQPASLSATPTASGCSTHTAPSTRSTPMC